jgi:hypothetical protein
MIDWWDALQLEKQIFYGIGLISLALLILQLFLSLIGAGLDQFDLPGSGDHSSGLGVLSIRSVTAFFAGFGWIGVICLNNGLSLPIAIAAAFAAGGALMIGTNLLMIGMMALQSSGTLDYHNAIGAVGTVYSTVAADRKHAGQVEVLVQGRYITAEAFTKHSEALKPGEKVRVKELIGASTLLVEPLNSES